MQISIINRIHEIFFKKYEVDVNGMYTPNKASLSFSTLDMVANEDKLKRMLTF